MKIEWSLVAMSDREAIFDSIEADNLRAAAKVDDRIELLVERLLQTPEMGCPGRIAGTRELVVTRTAYIADYQIDGETVRILRVLHGAQEWPDGM